MKKGYKALFYGASGIGKSTTASFADSPYFLDLDGGLEYIKEINKSEKITSFEAFYKEVKGVLAQEEFKTLVIDSWDSLESLIFKQLIKSQEGIKSIEEFMGGYNKGYNRAKEAWEDLFKGVFSQITDSGKNIIFTGSTESTEFANPYGISYTKMKPRINKTSLPVIESFLDGIFFITSSHTYAPQGESLTEDELTVICRESVALIAKNRFNLPKTMNITNFMTELQNNFIK